MKRVAKFEKVSEEQFRKDWIETFGETDEESLARIYDTIKLPKRATACSAGYDFFTPLHIILEPGKTIKIPTGVRVLIDNDWVLKLYPRSGQGFKYGLRLANSVGVIDADYAHSSNEGHIFCKLINDSGIGVTVDIPEGTGFMQGIFSEYGITVNDDAYEKRNGGFGSTGM